MRGKRRPVYLMRVKGENLVAESLAELAELVEAAHDSGDHIELLVAHHPSGRPLRHSELDALVDALNENR